MRPISSYFSCSDTLSSARNAYFSCSDMLSSASATCFSCSATLSSACNTAFLCSDMLSRLEVFALERGERLRFALLGLPRA